MKTRTILLGALVPLGVAVVSGFTRPQDVTPAAAAAQPVAPWTIEYKKGEQLRYRTYIRITARQADDSGDIALTVRSTSKTDVKDATPEGVFTWDQVDEKAEVTLNGMAVASKEAPRPVTITFDKNGFVQKRVNPAADPFDPADKSLRAMQSIPVPTMPVKPGDSWKTEVPNPMMKNKFVTATSTFVGMEKLLGFDTLKVQIKMDLPSTFGATDTEIIRYEATYNVDAKTHQLVRMVSYAKNPVLPFPAKNVQSWGMTSRIVAGVNEKDDPEGEKLLLPQPKK